MDITIVSWACYNMKDTLCKSNNNYGQGSMVILSCILACKSTIFYSLHDTNFKCRGSKPCTTLEEKCVVFSKREISKVITYNMCSARGNDDGNFCSPHMNLLFLIISCKNSFLLFSF